MLISVNEVKHPEQPSTDPMSTFVSAFTMTKSTISKSDGVEVDVVVVLAVVVICVEVDVTVVLSVVVICVEVDVTVVLSVVVIGVVVDVMVVLSVIVATVVEVDVMDVLPSRLMRRNSSPL